MAQGERRPGPARRITIPGLRALAQKVPALREPEGLSRALLTLGGSYGAAYGQMRGLDRRGGAGTVLGQLLTFLSVLRLGWSVLRNGQRFRQRYHELAYQEAFYKFVLPLMGAAGAGLSHVVTVPGRRRLPRWLTFVPGLYLLATGAGLWVRTIRTLGLDTALQVYGYFPEEGRQITWGAYRVLRHPLYAGVSRVALGLALLRARVRSVAVALMVLGFFNVWIRLEESELVRRFGRGYEDYRRRVPALLPDSLEREQQVLDVIAGRES